MSDLRHGSLLAVDESGNIVTRPKTTSDKINNIDQWSDDFQFFAAPISAHPDQTQDLLHYMFVIREAAQRHGGFFWRTYDEQFRLRQSSQFMPWSQLNADLWLRCFSDVAKVQARADIDVPKTTPPPCIDFNKGYCKWKNCRYPHVCSASHQSNMVVGDAR